MITNFQTLDIHISNIWGRVVVLEGVVFSKQFPDKILDNG